ncbi:pro-epidermal growth factor-like [Stylophora pistillata]|uniref:pro-epidermal growth factor-like n=1 Tax=Stylophora pistillata TaxID=50429 RepID=UPI000C03E994|nr:pro-epidermal growth factor-like [Stylophora pistillata]
MDAICVDVDECVNSVQSLGCSTFSNCINFEGSFFCTCKEGYLGDGRTCKGRTEVFEMVCRNRGGLLSMCDKSGNYKCKCDKGHVYDSQTQTCRRIV